MNRGILSLNYAVQVRGRLTDFSVECERHLSDAALLGLVFRTTTCGDNPIHLS